VHIFLLLERERKGLLKTITILTQLRPDLPFVSPWEVELVIEEVEAVVVEDVEEAEVVEQVGVRPTEEHPLLHLHRQLVRPSS
jgi:hypothetical protein